MPCWCCCCCELPLLSNIYHWKNREWKNCYSSENVKIHKEYKRQWQCTTCNRFFVVASIVCVVRANFCMDWDTYECTIRIQLISIEPRFKIIFLFICRLQAAAICFFFCFLFPLRPIAVVIVCTIYMRIVIVADCFIDNGKRAKSELIIETRIAVACGVCTFAI